MLTTYFTYATISALVASTPGPSNYIAAHNGASAGLRKASFAITGHMSAVLLLAFLSAIGLSSLLVSSEVLFGVVKILGAGYLMYLGVKIIRGSLHAPQNSEKAYLVKDPIKLKKRHLWGQHFFIAASNPKAMLFFTALFPQFIDPEINLMRQFIPLACISLTSSFIFPFIYAWLGKKASTIAIPQKYTSYFQTAVGVAFMIFSLFLAFSSY